MTDKCKECMLESGHRMDCSVGSRSYTNEQLQAENKLYLEKNLELVRQNLELDRCVLEEIENRDHWEEVATDLAEAVGKALGVDVGEHSSANCPIETAKDWLNTRPECVEFDGEGSGLFADIQRCRRTIEALQKENGKLGNQLAKERQRMAEKIADEKSFLAGEEAVIYMPEIEYGPKQGTGGDFELKTKEKFDE